MSANHPVSPDHALLQQFACDAFESVRLLPTAPNLWQRLSTFVAALDGAARSALIEQIIALPVEGGAAPWLRCSALACLTREPRWLIRQAALVDETTPPDAVMVLLYTAWNHALVRAGADGAFVQLLRDIDAPRLQRLLAARLSSLARPSLPRPDPVAPGRRLRVAIYTPDIANSRHGGTTFTLNSMSVLAGLGVELRAFAAQEGTIPSMRSYLGGAEESVQWPVERESLKLHVPGEAQITLPNGEFSLRLRFEQIARAIHAYAPDLVIFVGLMSPLAFHLSAHYPMLGLSVHAVPPAVPVDVWLSAQPSGNAAQWPDLAAPRVAHFPFRFWPTGKATPVARSAVGLPDNAVVLVTVGSRLDTEIAPPWSGRMAAFVAAHSEVHWLLIGVRAGTVPPHVAPHPRIYTLPAQLKLETWLAACDIYVNPPRIGGGGTVATAMEQGLPVASYGGSDGGDKVGAWAATSDEQYFQQLGAWVADPAARRQVGDAMREQFAARLDLSGEAAAAGLMQACQMAIEAFNQRVEPGA